MDCSPPGSSVHGILQARILEWVDLPSSKGSSWPRDRTCVSYVSCTGRGVLYPLATWEALWFHTHLLMSLWLWISHHNWPWTLGVMILISSLCASLGINGDQIKRGEKSAGNSRGCWCVTILTSPRLVTEKDCCWLKKKMHDVKAVSYILFRASQGLWLRRQPLVALRNYSEELGEEPGYMWTFLAAKFM